MIIKQRDGLLVVEKNEDTGLWVDMVITENEDDKNLFTCRVVQGNELYNEWEIVVIGRYSLYKLMYNGQTVFFCDQEDVLGTIN